MKGGAALVLAMLVCGANVAAATPTLTATHDKVEPGFTQSLTLICKAKPEATFAVITSLTMFFTPDTSPPAGTYGVPPSSQPSAQSSTKSPTTVWIFNPYVVSAHVPKYPPGAITQPTTTTQRTPSTKKTTTPIPTTTTTPQPPPQKQTLATVAGNMVHKNFNGTAIGHVGIRGAESVLEVTIRLPTKFNTGVYSCQANGFDPTFMPINASDDKRVILYSTTQQELIAKMQLIDMNLKHMKQRWEQIDSSSVFHQSNGSFKGSKYLLSREQVGQVNLGQYMCNVQGGYLAEIDDKDEFEFVKNFAIKNLSNEPGFYNDVFLGATDHGHQGVWKFLHNLNKTPFLHWGGFPSNGYDCLILSQSTGFYMNDFDCSGSNRFLCEIPL